MNAIAAPTAFETETLSSKEIREIIINNNGGTCSLWHLDERHYELLDAGKPNDLRSIIAESAGGIDQRAADWKKALKAIELEEGARVARNQRRAARQKALSERAALAAN